MNSSAWDSHYDRERSNLNYPDENLLRLLKKTGHTPTLVSTALDLGCGSGRHLALLRDVGYGIVIGTDQSFQALSISRKHNPTLLMQCTNARIPIKSGIIDIAVAWGSLHYTGKNELSEMIDEIHRLLKNGGILLATLRSSRDTYLKSGHHLGNNVWVTDLQDLNGATVSFFDKSELDRYFRGFQHSSVGYTERSIVGNTDKVISHWLIMAKK